MDIKFLSEVLGWAGTFLIVLAYFLVSCDKVKSDSFVYQSLNFFGALGVGLNVFVQQAWPALGLQVVWAGIAIYSLVFEVK